MLKKIIPWGTGLGNTNLSSGPKQTTYLSYQLHIYIITLIFIKQMNIYKARLDHKELKYPQFQEPGDSSVSLWEKGEILWKPFFSFVENGTYYK